MKVIKKPVEVEVYRCGIDEKEPDWFLERVVQELIYVYPDNKCRIKPYYKDYDYVTVFPGDYIIYEDGLLYSCTKEEFDHRFIVLSNETEIIHFKLKINTKGYNHD